MIRQARAIIGAKVIGIIRLMKAQFGLPHVTNVYVENTDLVKAGGNSTKNKDKDGWSTPAIFFLMKECLGITIVEKKEAVYLMQIIIPSAIKLTRVFHQ